MPGDDPTVERFSGLVLQLRGRIGLTQRELAERLDVHAHSIQAWEAGVSIPSAASLRALVAAAWRAGGFTAGDEADEAAVLWATAMRGAPRLRTPFDRAWFGRLQAVGATPIGGGISPEAIASEAPPPAPGRTRRHSWGEAPDVVGFVGRALEREALRRWVADEWCRVVAVLGLG